MPEVREALYYNPQHDWVRVEGGAGVLGITDYAQGELGDIVFLELPQAGSLVTGGQSYGTVEAVKTVADLVSPVSGEVVEVNHALEEDAALVNQDPYGQGWILKVRLSDPGEIRGLMDARAYRDLLGE